MRRKRCTWIALFALSFGPAACGGGGDKPSISFQVALIDFLTSAPLQGVDVCLVEKAGNTCQTTDAAGEATLAEVPGNSKIFLRFSKTGYASVEWPKRTAEADLSYDGFMVDDSTVDAQFALFDMTRDHQAGQIGFKIGNPEVAPPDNGLSGITATLSPDSAEAIFYNAEGGLPSLDPTATTGAGAGGLANVPPGEYTLNFVGLPAGCFAEFGHGDDPASQPVTVRADMTTWLYINCSQ